MRTSNFGKGRRAVGFFRLCLGIIVSLTLAMGGIALNTRPVQAITLHPTASFTENVTACVPFTIPFTYTNVICLPPPPKPFFWTGAGTYPTTWTASIDQDTGLLTGCPDIGDVGNSYAFDVGVTEFTSPSGCGPNSYWITVTLKVVASTVTTLTITPTVYPAAWENMPYSIMLTATGCSATPIYNWIATGLPAGLTLDSNTGSLSGVPTTGTCGTWPVIVTCTDTSMCPSATCCPPTTATLYLFVDCYSNYFPSSISDSGSSTTTATYDYTVQIGPGLTTGQTNVVVDGNQEATLGGNQSQSFTADEGASCLVTVDQIIAGPDPTTRFSVKAPNQIPVSETNNTAYFDYAQEVLINTGSDPNGISQPGGTGWYAINGDFNSTAASPVVSVNQKDVKYLFRAWSLPDGSTNPNRDLAFTVNRSGTATALYDTYYLLQVKSDYPSVDESSYELKGSTASYNLALQAAPMLGFWGALGGVLRPMNSSGSHLMDGPYTQKINWSEDWFWPIFWIVVTLLAIAAVVFFVLRRKRGGAEGTVGRTEAPVKPPADETTTVKTETVDNANKKDLPKTAHNKPINAVPAVSAAPAVKKALPKAEPAEKPGFCSKCGSPVDKGAEFCKKCGNKLA